MINVFPRSPDIGGPPSHDRDTWLHIQYFAPIIPEYALYEALYLPAIDKYLARRVGH